MDESDVPIDHSDQGMIRMHNEGMSMAAICQQLGISRERVRQRLGRNGISGPNYNKLPSRNDILSGAGQAFSLDDLAIRLAVNMRTLELAMQKTATKGQVLDTLTANRENRTGNRREKTRSRYVQTLIALAVRVGHTPTQDELEAEGLYHASLAEVFGSASDAMVASGLTPNERGQPPKQLPSSLAGEFELTDSLEVLEDRARIIRVRGELTAPPAGNQHPGTVSRSVQAYRRDPAVVAWVRQIANGICEACGVEGYETDAGDRFLEVHHMIPLGEGGPDTIGNAMAICELCHGKLHRWIDRDTLVQSIRARVPRLKVTAQ